MADGLPTENGLQLDATEGFADPSQFESLNGFANDPNLMMSQMGMATVPMMDQPVAAPITAEEIALYDRQIRLWGVQAQEKIRSANILLIGFGGLGVEITKNLVLAGIGTLTILEHALVMEEDLGTNFFVNEEHIGQNRVEAAMPEIKKLNPRVNLYNDTDIVFTKMPEYFQSFDITIATGLPLNAVSTINSNCRGFGQKFYAADVQGMYGYIFADLVIHQFTQERLQSNVPTKPGKKETSTQTVISVSEKIENGKNMEVVLKQEEYSPFLLANTAQLPAELTRTVAKRKKITPLLSCLRALFDFQDAMGRLPGATAEDLQNYTKLVHAKHLELGLPNETMKAEFLRSFLQNLGSEISPVVAYLGGRLAQDVINVLGQREQPLQNFLLFDAETLTCPVYSLQPVFDDSALQPVFDSMLAATEMQNGVLATT
ncbi:DNA damage tolerance protein RHC31 [Cyphellophora attinorum]|uniref:Ubiquitin-like 1-activating enzyme E1A n=1 Tax=Cyphellophora attinorum TaxID=1664694 RepID=A0A0N1H0X8_9EURO|nr:DNA damage tolerance protein RHC31 [Phialophora attinorum]KPI37750.1 DNA damage tolerance protein RHC31 [Phialophora attinorum]